MPKERKRYKRIEYADRQLIEEMCRGKSYMTSIAKAVGVDRVTLYREFQRTGLTRDNYSADAAQKKVR